jgi:hypothetical protein
MGLERLARLDGKAGHQGIQIGIGVHLGGVNIQLFAPDQLGLATLLHNGFKEAAKHAQAIAGVVLQKYRRGGAVYCFLSSTLGVYAPLPHCLIGENHRFQAEE